MGLGHRLNKAIERWRKRNWRRLERFGWHLTPNHFYQPIPDTRLLSDEVFTRESELRGVDLQLDEQRALFSTLAEKFAAEFNAFPQQPAGDGFHDNNGFFNGADAFMLYALVRHHRPARIIEVGSGFSTRLAAEAVRRNDNGCELTAIEPWPSEALLRGFPGLKELLREDVQNVPLGRFEALEANDILFLDSSHVMKIGSDVQYEFFEIIPRLRPGVLVHFHDIFIPREYPREWVVDDQRFWNEQYVVQAFLMYNDAFEIIWTANWHHLHNAEQLAGAVESYRRHRHIPASLWLRRVK